MDIKKKIKALPRSPGVYIMKDKEGRIIYIGKAVSLRDRVASYFGPRQLSARLRALVDNVADIDHILAKSEADALLLENALIKSNQPKYNVALRDDKSYPLLKLTLNEKFPRLIITRRRKNDGARYFGPYTEAALLRKAMGFLKRVFPLRTCKTMPKGVCLNFYLNQCMGPCAGKVGEKRYREAVNQLVMFLEGKRPELLKELEKTMFEASKEKRYEDAAAIRDQIRGLTQAISAPASRQETRLQLEALKDVLGLKAEPKRIEAFDISNISAKFAVGSMVSFLNGMPDKNNYRKFRIKEVSGIDDYAMIKEVVRRRYSSLVEDKKALPDLVIIDGGKGHLSAAKKELEQMGLENLAVISIAKEFEHIYQPKGHAPLILPTGSAALYLIQRIRDEAHRFAIGYHKNLRERFSTSSVLDGIKGVGPSRKAALIRHFGSFEGIKRAGITDLLEVKGITKQLAQKIKLVSG